MRWGYVLCGLSVLFIGSFFDNSRGPLIPIFSHSLSLAYGTTSLFLVFGTFTAMIGTLTLIPLLRQFGSRRVTIGVTWVALAGTLYSYCVTGFVSLIVLAILVGFTVAAFGALCNVLMIEGTDLCYRGRFFCGLHTMYGIGSLVAPLLVGYYSKRGLPWPVVFATTIPFLLLLMWALHAVLPVKEVAHVESAGKMSRLTRIQWLIVIAFSIYVGGEVMTSMWMVTYLVEGHGMNVSEASSYLSGFFLMMALTRALCFMSLRPEHERWLLGGSLFVSILLLIWARSPGGPLWALSLGGVLGPFFPLFLARVSRNFPVESKPLTIWILAGTQLTMCLMHLFVGRITDVLGIQIAYWLAPGLLTASLGLLALYLVAEKHETSMIEPATS